MSIAESAGLGKADMRLKLQPNGLNADNTATLLTMTEIKPKDNGPLLVQGDFKVVDMEGNEFVTEQEIIALCRCGHSENKPFCDGSHKQSDFEAVTRA